MKEMLKENSPAARYFLLLGCNLLFVLGYAGCILYDWYKGVEIVGLSGIYLLIGFPVYAVLYGIFSCMITKKVILPQIWFWLFFNVLFFIGLLFSNTESIIEEMSEFAVFISILAVISAFFAVIAKLVYKATSKYAPEDVPTCEKNMKNEKNKDD